MILIPTTANPHLTGKSYLCELFSENTYDDPHGVKLKTVVKARLLDCSYKIFMCFLAGVQGGRQSLA